MMKVYKKWKTSVTLKFLKEYEMQSCLWDHNSPDYKKKCLRLRALKEMEDRMNIKDFTVVDVSRKVHALRATYLNEIKKIIGSQRSGDDRVYKPKLPWFATAHRFLQKVVILNGNQFQINQVKDDDSLNRSFSSAIDTNYFIKDSGDEYPQDNLKLEEESDDNQNVDSLPKKKDESRDLALLHRAIESLRQLAFASRINPNGNKHDEFDVFASSVAVQLRNLPLSVAYDIQLQIANIFTHAKKESLTEQEAVRKNITYFNTAMKPEY